MKRSLCVLVAENSEYCSGEKDATPPAFESDERGISFGKYSTCKLRRKPVDYRKTMVSSKVRKCGSSVVSIASDNL